MDSAWLHHATNLQQNANDKLHAAQCPGISLYARVVQIGAVQGAAQLLCQLTKGVSGVVGDLLGSQVRVLVAGTTLTLMCKPMFALLSRCAQACACFLFWILCLHALLPQCIYSS